MDSVARILREELVPVIIVLVLLFPFVSLLINQQPVPEELKTLVTVVVSFYFGAKATTVASGNGIKLSANAPSSATLRTTDDGSSTHG